MNSFLIRSMAVMAMASLAACSWFDHSKGDGSAPPKGGTSRRFTKTTEEVAHAASETLQELGVGVISESHDALGGSITAERSTADKQPVTVWYKSLDPRSTEVSVVVGQGDRQLGQQVLDRMAQKLGTPGAAAAVSVGASAEGMYDEPLAQCMQAAEAAIKELRMNVTRRETHDTWSALESREADAIAVQAKMERTEKDKTRVLFTVGTSKNQDTQQLADRLRAEFEKKLGSPSKASP